MIYPYKWIARDKDGGLYLFTHKPKGRHGEFYFTSRDNKKLDSGLEEINSITYPEITYENSPQPWPISKKKETELKVGDVVYHKAHPTLRMCLYRIIEAEGDNKASANVEFWDKESQDFERAYCILSSLVRWGTK